MVRTVFSMLRPVALAAALVTCIALPASVHAQRRGGGGGAWNGGGYRGGGWNGGGYRGGGWYGDGYRGGWYGGSGIGIGGPWYGGYRGGYYGDGWYAPNGVIVDNSAPIIYSDPAVLTQNPVIQTQSFYPPADATSSAQTATVDVRVPPNAEVFFDGDATRQRGPERIFQSPPLEPGKKFHYDVKVRFNDNGKMVEQTRQIAVKAGAKTDVDFTRPESAPAPAPEK
jgi:uncharacterized protein (TIGR03000 family)